MRGNSQFNFLPNRRSSFLTSSEKKLTIKSCKSSGTSTSILVEELNLRLIPYYQNRYKCQVGYSGHEYDLEPTVLAVALGAKVIERHITISQEMWGTDQKSSLTVHAMNMLRRRVSQVDKMLGSDSKEVTKSEEAVRRKLRGS